MPQVDPTVWLGAGGILALYLAYRVARSIARFVWLAIAAAMFLGTGPTTPWRSPIDVPDAGTTLDAPTDAMDPGDTPRAVPPPTVVFRAVVTRIADGDSLRLRVLDPGGTGAREGEELEARLLRIDAPELARDGLAAECLADEARTALARLVPPGTEVLGAYDRERQDRFDRELVHLWNEDGVWVNGGMVRAGMARVVTFPPNDGYEADVRAAEELARDEQRGIWMPSACPG